MKTQLIEPNLWQELKLALASPQSADLHRLCDLLDWVIAQLPQAQQLDTAGRAIEQIAEVFTLRFQLLMSDWQETQNAPETALPVLDIDLLESWVRQSMSVDFDAFIEQPQSKRQRKQPKPHPEDSIVVVVEDEAVSQVADWIEAQQNQVDLVRQLAGEEDPAKWSDAIAQWIGRNLPTQPVRLTDLLSELPMPWVEVWLALLLGRFELEQRGEFYSSEILIRVQREVE